MKTRNWVLGVATALIFGSAAAAPCATDTLAAYDAAASGCDITVGADVFHFDDFRVFSTVPPAVSIDPSDIIVSPIAGAAGFLFSLDQGAAAGEVFSVKFGWNVKNTDLRRSGISLVGATASGDGKVTGTLGTCSDGKYIGDPGSCPGVESILIAFVTEGMSEPEVSSVMPLSSFFDVFAEITIDGGLAGQAFLPGVEVRFTRAAVPEPAVAGLVLVGLAAAFAARRRKVRR